MQNLVGLRWSVVLLEPQSMFDKYELISFSQFMQEALYNQTFGYYMQEICPIGLDFTTSPEKTKAIAYACAKAWQRLSHSLEQPVFCEIGPGTGQLTYDILEYMNSWDCLPDAVWLIELNPMRQMQQREKFASLPNHIQAISNWATKMPSVPWQGMILGNEVIDAQPFDLICYKNNAWHELKVQCPDLKLRQVPLGDKLKSFMPVGSNFVEGYTTEVCSSLPDFIKDITCNLTAGGILLLDYGYHAAEYYHPQRNNGTSMSFYQNQATNRLLDKPGKQDITAHVDFSFLASQLLQHDFIIDSYLTKAQYLLETKTHEYLLNYSGIGYHKECAEFKSVIFEMGDIFKVILASKGNKNWHNWLKGLDLERLGI